MNSYRPVDERVKESYRKEIRKFAFNKVLVKYVEIVLRNKKKQLDDKDLNEIAEFYYNKKNQFLKHRIRRILEMSEVQTLTDNALKEFLIKHNLEENKAFEVLNDAIKTAKDKKDASTLLKISQFLFEIHNLNSKTRITQQLTQETDINSKLDQAKTDKITIKETRIIEK